MTDQLREAAPGPVTAEDLHYAHLARRIAAIEVRLERGSERMDGIDQRLLKVVEELERNSEITTDIRDILTAAKVGLRVLGGIGQAMRWLGLLATAGVAIYGAVYSATHGGQLPPK